MAKYMVTHKYNLGTTFNSSNLRCKGWTSQVLTWLGKRILKNVSSPSSPDSKMRVLHILIYPTFNFNTNLPCLSWHSLRQSRVLRPDWYGGGFSVVCQVSAWEEGTLKKMVSYRDSLSCLETSRLCLISLP